MILDLFKTRYRKTGCKFGLELMPGDGFGGFPWGTSESGVRKRLGKPMMENHEETKRAIMYVVQSEYGAKESMQWYRFNESGLSDGAVLCGTLFAGEFEECVQYVLAQISAQYGQFFRDVGSEDQIRLGWWVGGDTQLVLYGCYEGGMEGRCRVEVKVTRMSGMDTPSAQGELFENEDEIEACELAAIVRSRPELPDVNGFEGHGWGAVRHNIVSSLGEPLCEQPWPGKPDTTMMSYADHDDHRWSHVFVLNDRGLYKGMYQCIRLREQVAHRLMSELRSGLVEMYGDHVRHRRQDDPDHPSGAWYSFMWRYNDLGVSLTLGYPNARWSGYSVKWESLRVDMIDASS